MNTRTRHFKFFWLLAAAMIWPAAGLAQVPVDENGEPVGQFEAGAVTASEDLPVLSADELEELIGPIALYPDDLLAIVLPASTFPLQIVQAARFLEDLDDDSSLKPDEDWDDSVVALTNYPEVVELMSDDLDWTWRLGEAVVAQQTDVITAIEAFRDQAYAAGNLKSDDFQNVTEDEGTIHITPVKEDVIYVPYYEPERVVVYQPRPVYYYYPRPYPVYYYPYPVGYSFSYPYFWGVTTAFSIGWHSHYLHVWHHSYYGHPYYGRHYWNRWWYRRPDIHVHNNYYSHHNRNRSYDRYRRGDYWGPNTRRTVRSTDQRITRTRYYAGSRADANAGAATMLRGDRNPVTRSSGNVRPSATTRGERETRPPVTFRERDGTATRNRSNTSQRSSTVRPSTREREPATTPRATMQRPRNQATERQSTQQQRQRTTIRPSTRQRADAAPTQRSSARSASRPSETRRSFAAPSQSRQSSSRPSQPRRSTAAPSQSRRSYSAPTRSKPSYSQPAQSRQNYSRPSQSRPSYSKPSSSKPAQARSSRSSSKSGSNRSSRSSSRSSDSRRR